MFDRSELGLARLDLTVLPLPLVRLRFLQLLRVELPIDTRGVNPRPGLFKQRRPPLSGAQLNQAAPNSPHPDTHLDLFSASHYELQASKHSLHRLLVLGVGHRHR